MELAAKMSGISYVSCVLKSHGGCGPYLPKNEITMSRFHSLNDDVSSHIKALDIRIMKQTLGINTIVLQKGLIANRAKINEHDVEAEGQICPKHRYSLGKYYRAPQSCTYPNQQIPKNHNSKKKSALRPASLSIIERITKEFPLSASIGDCVCMPCRTHLTLTEETSDDNELEDSVVEDTHCDDNEAGDPSFSVSETNQSLPEINETISSLDDSVSPVKFRLRTPTDDASENTARSLKRKIEQCINAATNYFCEMLAPGQSSAVKRSSLTTSEAKKSDDQCPAELLHLVKVYKDAPSQQAKLVILTLLPENVSKTDTMRFFSCSKYMAEKARILRKVNGAGCPEVPKDPIYKQRLDMGKAEQFLDFLINGGYLQDVASGTAIMTLDNGTSIVVPHVISTSLNYHLVKVYENHCESCAYKPLRQVHGSQSPVYLLTFSQPVLRHK